MGKISDHDYNGSFAKDGGDMPRSPSAKHTSTKSWVESVTEFANEALEESKMEEAERRKADIEWEQSKKETAAAKRSAKEAEMKRIIDKNIDKEQKQKEVYRESDSVVGVDSWDYY